MPSSLVTGPPLKYRHSDRGTRVARRPASVAAAMHLLLTSGDAALRKRVRRDLEVKGHRVDLARDGVEAWHRLRQDLPDVLVADAEMDHMGGLELTRTVRRNPATRELPVMLLTTIGGATGAAALTSGRDAVDEIIVSAGAPDSGLLMARLAALLERLSAGRDAPAVAPGRSIVVTSAKGGAGVTTVTANLALALAAGDRSVIGIDLDLEYGDLSMLLDVRHAGGIEDLASSLGVDGDEVAPEDYLARHPSGLRVLASPRNPVDALRIDEVTTTHVLARLRALHDALVIDVPPGFGDPALVALTTADRVVVLVVPEVTALVRTIRLLGVLRSLDVPDERLVLVYNRSVDSRQLTRERAEAALERRFLADLPHERALFDRATASGHPVVELEPGHAVCRELRRLAAIVS